MTPLNSTQIDELLAIAAGSVSYQSNYARTTTTMVDGIPKRHQFASDFMSALREEERKAAYIAPTVPTVSGVRTQPYNGPFPRGKHSHKCKGCEERGQVNAVACYKSKCTRPQLVATCDWCRQYYGTR